MFPALQRLPETELYAVCTAHADTAQAAAEKYGVERAYGDDKDMDADPAVEAALVAVRVPAHYVLTKNALEAGKHVYCEWPLGKNTQGSRRARGARAQDEGAHDGRPAAARFARVPAHAGAGQEVTSARCSR